MIHPVRALIAAFAVAAVVPLGACGGGGGSGPTVGPAQPSASPAVTPAPTAVGTQAFHIVIESSGIRTVALAPSGASLVLPPGFLAGSPVANAAVTYPDGSVQYADGSGVFRASASSYAAKYAATLQTSAAAQPFVKVSDPQGGVVAAGANVVVYASSGATPRLGGVVLLPTAALLFSGSALTLVAAGTDVDDLVASLGNAQVSWQSANGATIVPLPGTNQATYLAPALPAGSQPSIDTVTVTVIVAGVAVPYTAATQVQTIATGGAFTATGTIAAPNGLLGGGTAAFIASDRPRLFPSFNFFALADANGAYSALLPPNMDFNLGIDAPGSAANISPATLTPGGGSSFTSGAAGASGVANLLLGTSGELDDSKDDAKNAYPDPVVSVRDAWLAREVTRPYPFWADAGVLGVLTAGPSNGPMKSIGSGLFAQWCYQWQNNGGTNVLAIVENADATCTAPGNDAFDITPQASSGAYAFMEYRTISGGYALSGTVSASANALLVASGSWQQNLTNSGGGATGDLASVQIAFYGPVSQTLSSPVGNLAFQYTYSASGNSANNSASVQLGNITFGDPVTGLNLATGSAALTRSVATSSCVGSGSSICYAGTASLVRTYAIVGTSATRSYTTQDVINGDGSEMHTVTNANSGASYVTIPIASALARAQGSCIVCSSKLGALFDSDGQTQIGAYTVSASQAVGLSLLNTSEGDLQPGTLFGALGFVL